jgi:hypothetical protein
MPESVASTTPSVYDLDANHGMAGTKFRSTIGDRERVRPRAGAGVSSDTAFLSTLMVAKAPWSDEVLLEQVRHHVLPAMQNQGLVVAGIVDDTGSVTATVHQ